jgi:nitrogenase molybdenum-iron protein alpha/beta subunit
MHDGICVPNAPSEDARCLNHLWPCAMNGAAACLAGIHGMGVVIHGSSGCYFYTASLLEPMIHGTCLLESEVILGAGKRLSEVVEQISPHYSHIAIVNTCVPAILGEEAPSIHGEKDLLIIDCPGFIGDMESGYHRALRLLSPALDEGRAGVNIDGLNPIDPFYRGNYLEAIRLFTLAGIPPAAIVSRDTLHSITRASPMTMTVNPDLASGIGKSMGSFLGLDGTESAFRNLAASGYDFDMAPIREEVADADQRIGYASDKFLRRFDPPTVAIFSGFSYAVFAAEMLVQYLDAEIICIGSRNEAPSSRFPVEKTADLGRIQEMIEEGEPDLIIGSSYERSVSQKSAFIGLTPPIKNRVTLHARPLIGPQGALLLMEEVLNACLDYQTSRR